jgi:phosphoribosylformylglycinamidine cyclo-ligase
MSVVVSAADADKAVDILRENGEDAYVIGHVVASDEGVIFE